MGVEDNATTEAAGRVGIGRRSAALGLAGALAGLTGAVSAAAKEKGKVKKSKKKPKKTPAGLVRRFDVRTEGFTVGAGASRPAVVKCLEGTAKERVVAISGGFLLSSSQIQALASQPEVEDLAGWEVLIRNPTNADIGFTVYVRCAYLTK